MVATPQFGAQPIGPYKLKARIGQNNITGVYEALHRDTGEEVALRLFYNVEQEDIREKFTERVKDVANLSHPALVPVIDHGVTKDVIYLAMPMMSGSSLKKRLTLKQTITNHENLLPVEELPSLGEVSAMLDRLADALDYLHGRDMVHYHMQPSNVLFDIDGNTFLADTGIARILKVVFSLQATNAINTNPYAPPEQWAGEVAVAASDQYALACVIYELVTGRPLFQSNSIFKLMNMHMNEFLIPPHHVRSDVPANLTNVLVRALAKSPQERYATVREFATAFRETVSGYMGTKTDFFTFDVKQNQRGESHHHTFVVPNAHAPTAHKPIEHSLKQANYSYWQDDQNKVGSVLWKDNVRHAVKYATCVILPISTNTMQSDWVKLALSYAKRYEKPVYAVLMDEEIRNTTQFEKVFDAREDQSGALQKLCTYIGKNNDKNG